MDYLPLASGLGLCDARHIAPAEGYLQHEVELGSFPSTRRRFARGLRSSTALSRRTDHKTRGRVLYFRVVLTPLAPSCRFRYFRLLTSGVEPRLLHREPSCAQRRCSSVRAASPLGLSVLYGLGTPFRGLRATSFSGTFPARLAASRSVPLFRHRLLLPRAASLTRGRGLYCFRAGGWLLLGGTAACF